MNNRPKKPPVNITELKEEVGKEVPEKGPLNYMGEKNNPGGGPAPKSKINLTQLILAVGLSVIVFFVIAQFTLASKGDAMTLLDNQRLLESSQAATETQLNTETGRIENIIAAQATFAQKSELAGFNSAITSIGNRVDEIEPIVNRIEPIVDDHEDRITVLEAAINGTVILEGGGSLDYYITDSKLYIKSSRSGLYRIKFILIPKSVSGFSNSTTYEVLEYYTGSYALEGGEWEDKFLPSSLGSYSSTHDVYVDILLGNSIPGGDTGEW